MAYDEQYIEKLHEKSLNNCEKYKKYRLEYLASKITQFIVIRGHTARHNIVHILH